jgi:predicted HTH transcriptional regulator
LSERTITRAIKTLKDNGLLIRMGAKKNGYWQVNDIEKK